MRPALLLALVAASSFTAAVPARGEPSAAEVTHLVSARKPGTTHASRRRFSNGPRRVPRPRGASLRRAQALGLGTDETARHLLRRVPKDTWTAAVRGEDPKPLLWPVAGGHFGRGFGYVRKHRPDLRHNGVDIGAPEGAVVRAVADGIVAYSDNGVHGFGNCVMIVHRNGWVSLYAHHQRNTVQAGWRVRRGERIAFVGQTGIARGPHLHFELRVGGRPIDPMGRFRARAARRGTTKSPDRERAPHPSGPAPSAEAHAARRLLRAGAPASVLEGASLRHFSNLLWPVRGGAKGRPFEAGAHRGIDITAELGAAVRAAADGVVVYTGDDLSGVGHAVIVAHENGWVTLYGSLRDVAVEVGEPVLRGEWLAHVGTVDDDAKPHLHFELHERGTLRDPAPLLVQVPASGGLKRAP